MVDSHVAHANMVVADKDGGLAGFACKRELLVFVGFFCYGVRSYYGNCGCDAYEQKPVHSRGEYGENLRNPFPFV